MSPTLGRWLNLVSLAAAVAGAALLVGPPARRSLDMKQVHITLLPSSAGTRLSAAQTGRKWVVLHIANAPLPNRGRVGAAGDTFYFYAKVKDLQYGVESVWVRIKDPD